MSEPFVTQLSQEQADLLKAALEQQEFEMGRPEYTFYQAKKKGISCTLYLSGKLVVQGKNAKEFIEFFLEPEILKKFVHGYAHHLVDGTPRIGVDESGKGDFFGPLCIAGVFAKGEEIGDLHQMGVRDSKTLSDVQVEKIAPKIKGKCAHHVIRIGPLKYNDLYPKFGNLNTLLGWGHAAVIEELVKATGCTKVIVDQFASEHVVLQALKKKQINIDLEQRHKAEQDLVVAAASILARFEFLTALKKLSEQFGIKLPKGASAQVIEAGRLFVSKQGRDSLCQVAKLHFKTLDAINGKGEKFKF